MRKGKFKVTSKPEQGLTDDQILSQAAELPEALWQEFVERRRKLWNEHFSSVGAAPIRTLPSYLVGVATAYAELYQRSLDSTLLENLPPAEDRSEHAEAEDLVA